MSLFRSIATVGGFTMMSRVTGLMREMMIAHYLGAGAVADAFFVAFRFPNLFRSLFAEGAFNAAFVPLFTGKLTAEGREEARLFAERALAVLFVALALFVAVMEVFMPWAMLGLAPGFEATPGKMDLAVEFSRICFPYLLFISLTSLQAGVLNSLGRFAAAAATPVLLNLTSMAGLWLLVGHTPTAGHAMAWGTFAAGIIQFAWLFLAARRAGMGLSPRRPRLSPEVRLLFKRIVPGAVGAGVYQVNLVINTMIASMVADGAVSYLNYADRVNQLPLGVVGIAIGTALLPLLSRQLKEGAVEAAKTSQNRAMEFGLILTLPAATALMVIAVPVIRVLFERGSFGPHETEATASALVAFALGLPAYVLVKVLTPAFFAREDTATPVRVAGATMALNVALNLALAPVLGHVGMALSTALAAWFNVAALAFLLKRRGFFAMDERLRGKAPRIIAACAVMGAALWAGKLVLWPLAQGQWTALAVLAGLVVAGVLAFAVAAQLLGAASLADIKSMMRRKG
ncbi:murein biosynthesis integral membrane protein MurJ [Paramagnetospirillum kuznetsovii]|uniref:Probable lipid II flippase MurJ n=1 Tax=Paramagnetospirillum kuznetsovii TaxID=2053833 RepID=A0A364P3G3_9PROT|nr:murein biosynthesis integral membrane protein MurJ [Paramagnetospirillum kuznetsovii]RAU23854.1 murein biosynthesis integral membrane protein MurJ [Paramagnetospirillum kuznetsovii]